jgi:hypothetical protein
LSATAATVAGTPTPTRTWQWYRGASPISGATSDTYVLVVADEGKDISVEQIETNIAGLDSAVSSAVTVALALILDNLTATAAYSTRKLGSAYTGNAIRVRRSSNNQELNIGFTASGDLDIAALLDFVGSGDGFVTTEYDQSGNGRHAVQTVASEQPQIVSNGAVITMNGRPALRFDGTDMLNTPLFILGNTVVTVARRSATNQPVVEGANVGSADRGLWGLRSSSSDFTTHLNYGINGGPLDATNADGFPVNLPQIVSQTVAKGLVATTESIWRIGGGTGGYVRLNGFISEMVATSSLLSTADRELIERNQGAYYGITVA